MPKRSFASFSIREMLLAITVIALVIPYFVNAFRSRDEPLHDLDLDPGYFAEWAKELASAARLVGRYYGGGGRCGIDYFASAEVVAHERLHKQIWFIRLKCPAVLDGALLDSQLFVAIK